MRPGATGLPVTLDLEDRLVVLVGADAEAAHKLALVLEAGARVRWIWPTQDGTGPASAREALAALEAEVAHAQTRGAAIERRARAFQPEDLDGAILALVAPRDPSLADVVRAAARARGVLVWACDQPERSDLALPAIARLGLARVAISTSGASPVLAGLIRRAVETSLGDRFARFVAALGAEREALRPLEPDFSARRARLRALLDGFALELQVRYPDWFHD